MAKVTLGIDLGTTNTVCCRFDNSLEFVKFKGKELLPSVLYYREGKIMVGDSARKKAITHPENVIMSSKLIWVMMKRHGKYKIENLHLLK